MAKIWSDSAGQIYPKPGYNSLNMVKARSDSSNTPEARL